jgi:DNA-binding Xre family transcriptional regulator
MNTTIATGVHMAIRLRLAELAGRQGLTPGDLRKKSGVPAPTVLAHWRNERGGIDWTTLEKFANALNVHPKELIGRSDNNA